MFDGGAELITEKLFRSGFGSNVEALLQDGDVGIAHAAHQHRARFRDNEAVGFIGRTGAKARKKCLQFQKLFLRRLEGPQHLVRIGIGSKARENIGCGREMVGVRSR